MGGGRVFGSLVLFETLFVSSFQPTGQSVAETESGRSSKRGCDNSRLADGPLVSSNIGDGNQTTTSVTPVADAADPSPVRAAASAEEVCSPSRVEFIRSRLEGEGICSRAATYILESWRAGMGKQYSAAWSCFTGWCKQRTRDPVQATVGTVCDFLSDQFGEGKSYSTVNSYRSALSGMLVPVNGRPIGEHSLIVRLLKGMFNVRPPVPRYNGTWDVNIVLKLLENWHPLETLEMKQLTFKTVALVGQVSAQRSQALAALTLKDMSVLEDGTRFCVLRLLKTSRPGKSSTPIMVPKNTSNGKLCPHTTLQTYISRTESVRNSIGTDSIFISLRSPFMAVGSSSQSRWLKTVLSLAGIDSSVYTGHSLRSASTSKVSRLEVPLDTILSTADWKNSGTFFKYYKKDVTPCNFIWQRSFG